MSRTGTRSPRQDVYRGAPNALCGECAMSLPHTTREHDRAIATARMYARLARDVRHATIEHVFYGSEQGGDHATV
jgi:hypothetical protein